jgi:hypothetical protein
MVPKVLPIYAGAVKHLQFAAVHLSFDTCSGFVPLSCVSFIMKPDRYEIKSLSTVAGPWPTPAEFLSSQENLKFRRHQQNFL